MCYYILSGLYDSSLNQGCLVLRDKFTSASGRPNLFGIAHFSRTSSGFRPQIVGKLNDPESKSRADGCVKF